jgi:MarR-like DNA-binding transcriptional regulator SgrR of sgrS sRNA
MSARKYVIAVVCTLLVVATGCTVSRESAGQQDITLATKEPEAMVEQSSLESEESDLMINLPDLGPAPDITNEVWLNSDTALNLEAVRGRVVLLEFWTFG